MNHYTPQPGTISARVINALKELPQGKELSTPEVLEIIGQPSDWHGLSACLQAAVNFGALKRRTSTIGPKVLFWSLGDGVAIATKPTQEAAPKDEPKLAGSAEPVAQNKPDPTVVDGGIRSAVNINRAACGVIAGFGVANSQVNPWNITANTPAPREFNCGIFTDGRLVLEFEDGTTKQLSAASTTKLVDYLERMAPEEVAP
jgi:hypothetical protein